MYTILHCNSVTVLNILQYICLFTVWYLFMVSYIVIITNYIVVIRYHSFYIIFLYLLGYAKSFIITISVIIIITVLCNLDNTLHVKCSKANKASASACRIYETVLKRMLRSDSFIFRIKSKSQGLKSVEYGGWYSTSQSHRPNSSHSSRCTCVHIVVQIYGWIVQKVLPLLSQSCSQVMLQNEQ